jgi:hypothetical protein
MARITYDSSDDEEYDMEEDEAIAMLLIMHRNKRPKHDGSVFGREVIHRERMGQPLELKLLQNGTGGKMAAVPRPHFDKTAAPSADFAAP